MWTCQCLRRIPPPLRAIMSTPAALASAPAADAARAADLRALFAQRIAMLDGAMGSMIQTHPLDRGGLPRRRASRAHPHDLKGNNDLLASHAPRPHRPRSTPTTSPPAPTSSRPTRSAPRPSRRPTTGWKSIVTRAQHSPPSPAPAAPRSPGRGRHARPPLLRRRRHRPAQPHALDVARRQPARLPRRHVGRGRRRLHGAESEALVAAGVDLRCSSRRSSTPSTARPPSSRSSPSSTRPCRIRPRAR
jgi:hypothetical protein